MTKPRQLHILNDEPTRDKRVLFSSVEDEYETPPGIFDPLNKEFGFDLDVCATPDKAKCGAFFTPEMDGLSQSWADRRCWLNPPYTRRQIRVWLLKAIEESARNGATVVCLVPARTDTAWWHDLAMMANEIRLIRGRIRFVATDHAAPFPSAVLIYKPGARTHAAHIHAWDVMEKGHSECNRSN